MILVRVFGGLGNQLFQYAAAKALALRNGVALKLDINSVINPDSHKRVYCLHNFNINTPIAGQEEIEKFLSPKKKYFKASRYILNKTGFGIHKSWWCQSYIYQGFYERYFYRPLKGDVYLDGYWQNEKLFIDYRDELLKELSFKEKPDNKNQEVQNLILTVNAVSLHVRRGDALTEIARTIYKLPGEAYYKNAIEIIASRISNPQFFVFSDDIEWCRNNIKTRYPMEFVAHNDDNKNYEDLRLMSSCNHHITANSTFSWWGAWLNPSPDKIVVTPAEWFCTKKLNNNKIVPDSWIKV